MANTQLERVVVGVADGPNQVTVTETRAEGPAGSSHHRAVRLSVYGQFSIRPAAWQREAQLRISGINRERS